MNTFFKSELPSRADVKAAKKREADARQREVYRHVNVRDGFRCRCCGAVGDPRRTDLLGRLHHHHIVFRSASKAPDTTGRICLLCAKCHADVHAHRLHVDGDADAGLEFWWHGEDGWWLLKREIAPGRTERD